MKAVGPLCALLWLGVCVPGVAGPLVVCIDPGHPSEVGWGTRGRHVTEVQVAWDVAILLRKDLQAQGVTVVMTKHAEKEFVRNRMRAEIANRAHANLMVRLHCDAGSGSGFAVYFPDHTGVSAGVRGPSRSVLAMTRPVATRFHAALASALRGFLPDRGLFGDEATAVGHKQGALTGSVFSQVPVVLVEMAVLTNAHDERLIGSHAGQARMASALARATLVAINRR